MPKSSKNTDAADHIFDYANLSYEEAFSELEQIVAQMESGNMPLEDALNAFKKGNLLLEHCQKSLADVEQQIQILSDRQQLSPFKPDND